VKSEHLMAPNISHYTYIRTEYKDLSSRGLLFFFTIRLSSSRLCAILFYFLYTAYKLQSTSRYISRCRDFFLRLLFRSCSLGNIRKTTRRIGRLHTLIFFNYENYRRNNVMLVAFSGVDFSTLVDINYKYLNSFCFSILIFFTIFCNFMI